MADLLRLPLICAYDPFALCLFCSYGTLSSCDLDYCLSDILCCLRPRKATQPMCHLLQASRLSYDVSYIFYKNFWFQCIVANYLCGLFTSKSVRVDFLGGTPNSRW